MKTLDSIKPLPRLVRIAVAAVLYVAGNAAIVVWSLPDEGPADRQTELAMRLPDTGTSDAAGVRSTPVRMTGNARNKANCEECGVIESVRRIDKREEMMEWCAVGDIAGTRIPGNTIDGGERLDVVSLADTVAGVIVGDRGTKKGKLTTRHQIVVRFRDGSRHVFIEETPRTLRVGDRIQVIAGAAGASG
jgi:outer membrane lipoprotein SlyB